MEQNTPGATFLEKCKTKIQTFAHETWWFVSSGIFLKNCAGIIGFVLAFVWMTSFWLKCYTDHGESLEVPNFVGMTLEDAKKKAKNRNFNLVVSDSVYKADKPAYTILEQNPKPQSRVKEDRTIYLTTVMATAENVLLPDIAGGNDDYEPYSTKLKNQDINAEIIARKFDAILEPNTIIDVIWENDTITNRLRNGVKVPKGSTIYFIVSERENSNVQIPNLVCMKADAAKFMLVSTNLNLGNVVKDNSVEDEDDAYVWKQEPAHQAGATMRIGEQVTIYLTAKLPNGCGVTTTAPQD
jgi:beta-lactam-binding protein with PASTA domain